MGERCFDHQGNPRADALKLNQCLSSTYQAVILTLLLCSVKLLFMYGDNIALVLS